MCVCSSDGRVELFVSRTFPILLSGLDKQVFFPAFVVVIYTKRIKITMYHS